MNRSERFVAGGHRHHPDAVNASWYSATVAICEFSSAQTLSFQRFHESYPLTSLLAKKLLEVRTKSPFAQRFSLYLLENEMFMENHLLRTKKKVQLTMSRTCRVYFEIG